VGLSQTLSSSLGLEIVNLCPSKIFTGFVLRTLPEAPEDVDIISDSVDVEVYESWLEDECISSNRESERDLVFETEPNHHDHSHSHSHSYSHDYTHLTRGCTEPDSINSEGPETPGRRISDSLVIALISRKVITRDELRETVEAIDMLGAKREGPRIVSRAWADDGFRSRLLEDASAAASEIGISASNSTASTVLTAVENTNSVHNLVVCTLCSCYPLSILGLSPPWYKSRVFCARVVRAPRKLLKDEFGLDVPRETTVRVHDSSADLRYIVIPKRPEGTEVWTEEELTDLVTRDTMIGVAEPIIRRT